MQLPANTNATEESLNNLLAQLEEMEDLPSPPDIVTRIIELLRDPESDIKELMDTLTKDPALVAKILKTANSAMYARRREVTNLAQALLTLGQAAAMTLALSFSLVNSLRKNEGGGIDLVRYWQRSLLTAIGAQRNRRRAGRREHRGALPRRPPAGHRPAGARQAHARAVRSPRRSAHPRRDHQARSGRAGCRPCLDRRLVAGEVGAAGHHLPGCALQPRSGRC